jgi:hypothetical protein
MSRQHLPDDWQSTANSLEGRAFLIKDGLFTVDDFAPDAANRQQLYREAIRFFRAQGNLSGRGRARPDGTPRPTKAPRGLTLSTGEDLPPGHSIRARLHIVEVAPGAVDRDRLTALQVAAADGTLAAAMAGYLRWLAPQLQAVQAGLAGERHQFRARIQRMHPRTPTTTADLALGLQYFLRYAEAVGGITAAEHTRLWDSVEGAFTSSIAVQDAYQQSAEVTTRFLALLGSAIARGDAHVAGPDGQCPAEGTPARWGWQHVAAGTPAERWEPRGKLVGWIDDTGLYLDPESAYATAQALGGQGGDAVAVGLTTLKKRLHEKGLLARVEIDKDKTHYAVKHSLAGRRPRVLAMVATALDGDPETADAHCPTFVGQCPPLKMEVGHGNSMAESGLRDSAPLAPLLLTDRSRENETQKANALKTETCSCGNGTAVRWDGQLWCPRCDKRGFAKAVNALLDQAA